MKYIALLRGINVGGNNIIKMVELKEVVSKNGFTNVSTYIQSGNVIFESDESSIEKITQKIEDILSKKFNYTARVVVRSFPQLQKILLDVPKEWKKPGDIRCYIAFVKEPVNPETAVKEIVLKEGIDFVKTGPGVVYMTTLMSGITQSGFSKLTGKKIYKDLTIRNFNTTKKILELMS